MTPSHDQTTSLRCACGRARLRVHRAPITSVECHCDSCRQAAAAIDGLPGARRITTEANGSTRFVLYRKDRVEIIEGAGLLKAFRLTGASSSRRVIATCCNSPVCLEFHNGHWLSLYAGLWHEGARPEPRERTMTSDLADRGALDDLMPNSRYQSLSFYAKLFGAWVAMGFKSPSLEVAEGAL